MSADRLRHLWDYYQGAFHRLNDRIVVLRGQNANLIVLTVAVYSLFLAMVLFFAEREGFGEDLLLATLGATILFGHSFALSFAVFRPHEFRDVPVSEAERSLQEALPLEALLGRSIDHVRSSLLHNHRLYAGLLATHRRALYVFSFATAAMLVYMGVRVAVLA